MASEALQKLVFKSIFKAGFRLIISFLNRDVGLSGKKMGF